MKYSFNTILSGFIHPRRALWALLSPFFQRIHDDERFLRIKWLFTMNYPLHLDNPSTFNEKQNWLKLHDRRPEYTIMVDKYLVKEYVAKIIGEKYIIPTLGVWESPEDIDFDKLPDRFVLKCNHNSGTGMCICQDKTKLDLSKVVSDLRVGLSEDYYLHNREWPYKDVKRCILAEQFMEDHVTGELRDYKFFCFDGVVRCLFIATNRSKGDHQTRFDFFDADFNHLPIINGHPNADVPPSKPQCFEEMKRIASVLSRGIPSVRVDLYEIDGRVYFGELTFSHWGGFTPFKPQKWDQLFGDWIQLP